jgi:hypothetical protein
VRVLNWLQFISLTLYIVSHALTYIRSVVDAVRWDFPSAHVERRLLADGGKLGHHWLNAVFAVITLPDSISLNSIKLILKYSNCHD